MSPFFFLLHILLSLSYSHDSCSPSSQVPPFFQFFSPVLLLLIYDLDVFSAYLILLIKSYLNDQSVLSSISLLDSYVVGNFQSPGVNWVARPKTCKFVCNPWSHCKLSTQRLPLLICHVYIWKPLSPPS